MQTQIPSKKHLTPGVPKIMQWLYKVQGMEKNLSHFVLSAIKLNIWFIDTNMG